jgi:hypothetical protein
MRKLGKFAHEASKLGNKGDQMHGTQDSSPTVCRVDEHLSRVSEL